MLSCNHNLDAMLIHVLYIVFLAPLELVGDGSANYRHHRLSQRSLARVYHVLVHILGYHNKAMNRRRKFEVDTDQTVGVANINAPLYPNLFFVWKITLPGGQCNGYGPMQHTIQ